MHYKCSYVSFLLQPLSRATLFVLMDVKSIKQTKDFIIVPALNQTEDKIAIQHISKFFPHYDSINAIENINMVDIAKQQGALNCITWTIKV